MLNMNTTNESVWKQMYSLGFIGKTNETGKCIMVRQKFVSTGISCLLNFVFCNSNFKITLKNIYANFFCKVLANLYSVHILSSHLEIIFKNLDS